MTNDVAPLIHDLYNSLADTADPTTAEIRDTLAKAYRALEHRDPVVVANKLAKYLQFTGYNQKIAFTASQDALITKLSQAGQRAGLNGAYRAWYGDKRQF